MSSPITSHETNVEKSHLFFSFQNRYHGSMTERQEIKEILRQRMPRRGSVRSQVDVVLTTFSYFSSEKSDDRNFLRKFDWNYVSLLFNYVQRILCIAHSFRLADGSG